MKIMFGRLPCIYYLYLGLRASLLPLVWLVPASSQVFTVLNSKSLEVPSDSERLEIFLKVQSPKGTLVTTPVIVEDLSTSSHINLLNVQTAYVGDSGQSGFWRVTWQVSGLSEGISESRAILVKQGESGEILFFTFTRKPVSAVHATATGPASPLYLSQSRAAEFRIVMYGLASHVQATISTLIDEKTGRIIPADQFELADTPAKALPNGGLSLNDTKTVYLRVKQGFDKPGKYSGSVTLSAAEQPDLASFQLTVYSTNFKYHAVGVLLIALGLLLYVLIAIWAKNRAKRIQAELPATRLRAEVQGLISITLRVQQITGYNFSRLLAPSPNPVSLKTLDVQLAESTLVQKGFLPSTWASPFGPTDLSIQYQSYLQVTSIQINALSMIVNWGIATVEHSWPEVLRLNLQAIGNNTLMALDGLAGFSGPVDMIRVQIQAAVTELQNQVSKAGSTGGGSLVVQGSPTPRQLTIQLEQLSEVVWLVWALLTIFTGACALVLFNAGFGTAQDFIQCFLWGVGVPSVAQGFGALNANAITSSLSLPVGR